MRLRPQPKLAGYAALLAAGLLGAILLERVALVGLVAPLAIWLAVGLGLARRPSIELRGELLEDRTTEGEQVIYLATLICREPTGVLELHLPLPPGLNSDHPQGRIRLEPGVGMEQQLRWRLTPQSWGSYALGGLELRGLDKLGLFSFAAETPPPGRLRVYPARERLRQLIAPAHTQLSAGNRLSRQKGDGLEFADIRPFMPGDRARRVNWKATARTGVPQVNDFQVERNANLILFLDSFSELGSDRDSVLRVAVRAAAGLAAAYLDDRDRVGVVGFGGLLRWTVPGMGLAQLYRIVEAMLDTEAVVSYAWRAVDVIPPRVLPPAATVIALSPLLDPRAVGALADLNRRGFDLVVLEIEPEAFLPPGRLQVSPDALRLWRLLRGARIRGLAREGVTVVPWDGHQELQAVLARAKEVRRFRRKLVV